MEEVKRAINFIKKELNEQPQLVHARGILNNCTSAKGEKLEAARLLAVEYAKYLKAQISINGFSDDVINSRTKLLNKYYLYYDAPENGFNKLFSAQGKLRPTIIEEFFYFLFKDYLKHIQNITNDVECVLGIGSEKDAKAYTNLYFAAKNISSFVESPSIRINDKDQDFAIFRKVHIEVKGKGNNSYKTIVPIFAIEAKTYLDKTMLDGIVATAEKLKMGNIYSRFVVVTETYSVGQDVDPSYSQIDQIYVLRKQLGARNKIKIEDLNLISEDVILRLFKDAKEHIERPWSDIKTKLENEGLVI